MKYQPPHGSSDPDAPYVDGDPSIAREGSIVPAGSIELPQREIVNFINVSGLTPSDGDLLQLARSARTQKVNFAVDTGSVNALSIALDPPLLAYRQGLPIRVLVANTNTGPATINVNGLGPRPVKRANAANLVGGDIQAGGIAEMVDDGTSFQVVNFLGAIGGTVNNYTTDIPYVADTSVTPNVITANYAPPITEPPLIPGDLILVKVANENTGAVTITVNALAGKPVNRNDGQPLQARDLVVNETILLEYHGAYWQMMRLVRSQVFFKLTADLLLWVRTDGNDANNGSANDAAHAFRTIQGAINFIRNSFLIAGRSVTIRLGIPGTYIGSCAFLGIGTAGTIALIGDPAAHESYIIRFDTTDAVPYTLIAGDTTLTISGVTLYNGATNVWPTLRVSLNGNVNASNISLSGVARPGGMQIYVQDGYLTMANYIHFRNSAGSAIFLHQGGKLDIGGWFTLITNHAVNYSEAFLRCNSVGMARILAAWCGFAGSATGQRYENRLNSVIDTAGGGANYLPGSVAGVSDASSVYN